MTGRRRLSDQEIRAHVRSMRLEKGWKQWELAEMIGESTSTMNRIEKGGKSSLPCDLLQRLSDAFGITMDMLCYSNPEETKQEEINMEEKRKIRKDLAEVEELFLKISVVKREIVMSMIRGVEMSL